MAFYSHDANSDAAVLLTEDVSDFITNIDPDRTPLASSFGAARVTSLPHTVNEDTLASADADNAQKQGEDAPDASDTTPTQRSTYTQIFSKTAEVSGTLNALQQYGKGVELNYQAAKKMKEIKRDLEKALISSNSSTAPAGGATAGKLAGSMTLITTNVDSTAGSMADTSTGQAGFNSLLQDIYDGGGEPTQVFVGGTQKRNISENWTTNVTRYDNQKITTAVEVVDVYVSDFGAMNINYHWQMPVSDVLILQMDMWRLAAPEGRSWFVQPLSVQGDKSSVQILGEYTLECRAEKANGAFDSLTS